MPADDAVVSTNRISERVMLVTINRPHVRNAVSQEVADALSRVVTETENDPDVWAVIITGAGDKAFCAGADLNVHVNPLDKLPLQTDDGGFAGFVYRQRSKPWIAAVNGFALAGGCEIVLACDLVVAAEHAKFGLPEVKRGLLAGAGGMYRLVRALPKAIALEMILTGSYLEASQALHFGLINQVVPQTRLVDEALSLALRVCEGAPVAVRESRWVAQQAHDFTDAELREITSLARARNKQTTDVNEGARAFLEKRSPRWTGHLSVNGAVQ